MSDQTRTQDDERAGEHGADSGLSFVESLMAERRKYEQWIAALEARRASTPDRVFSRVHGDYHDRLDAVVEQLKEHTEGLRAELASLTLRLSAIEEEQQQRRDERAEAELRAHVGELSPEAWQQIAGDADRSIDGLAARHTELESELQKTRELLSEAERPSPARGAPAVPAPPAAPPARAEVPRAAASPRAEAHQEPPRTEPVAAPRAAAPVAEPVAPAAAPAPVPPDAALAASVADADVTPPPTQRADASRVPGATGGTFDELAFLSSVVDTPAGEDAPEERARRDSFAQRAPDEGIVNLSNDPGTTLNSPGPARAAGSPLAMNVSGNIPIVIKDKSSEAAKSLKCGECGAMNYPTEWYCERCGAELASL